MILTMDLIRMVYGNCKHQSSKRTINKVQTARSSSKKTNYPNKTSDSFAGTHVIRWGKVDFPTDGNYIIEVMVDDNAKIFISNGLENKVITKRGFSGPGKSTGKVLIQDILKRVVIVLELN